MKNVHFITYGDNKFTNSKIRIAKEADQFGFSTISVCSPTDIDNDFLNRHKSVFKEPRIGGYGIWRPYIIKKALEKIQDDEFLVYVDAGCTINCAGKPRFVEYLELLRHSNLGIISFQTQHVEKCFTTKEIFAYFDVSIDSEIANSGQFLDGILIMKKCTQLVELIDKWLNAVEENSAMFTDIHNNLQAKFFVDNRHEQSVFSVLRKKHGSVVIEEDETYFVPFGTEKSLLYPFWATRIRC